MDFSRRWQVVGLQEGGIVKELNNVRDLFELLRFDFEPVIEGEGKF